MYTDTRELSEYKHLVNPVVLGAVIDMLPTIELHEWDVYHFSTAAKECNFTSELRSLEEFMVQQLPGVRQLADCQRAVRAAGLSSGNNGKQGRGVIRKVTSSLTSQSKITKGLTRKCKGVV